MRPPLPVCIFLSISWLLSAQEGRDASKSSSPAPLHVEVVEGDGAINSIRLHRAFDPVVRVTDSGGEPAPEVTVTFLLPATGPSGTFPDGGLSSTIQTDDKGRAAARGLRPNSIEGQFQIRVTASSHGSEGAATLVQTNAEPVVRSSHTKLIVILAAIAGAAAGGAVLATRGGQSSPTPATTTSSGSISAGTPIFGPPH